MKYALISDIHGNLEALEAVLEDIAQEKPDKIMCLGDVIGYGSDPNTCLDLVNKYCDIILIGNHEYTALGLTSTENYNEAAKEASEWTTAQLSDREISTISNFKMTHSEDNILFVHASPFEPEKWHYIIAPNAALEGFDNFDEKLCFFGHTHLPQIFIEQPNGLPRCQAGHDFLPNENVRYLINTGSVGQPRDLDSRSCYLIFDTEEYEVIYRRVKYDINKTQSKMAAANMPELLITRLSAGR
jgi:predicted phosphodiesterase